MRRLSLKSTLFGVDPIDFVQLYFGSLFYGNIKFKYCIKKRTFEKTKSAFKLWAGRGLNPRPSDYESPALTPELPALVSNKFELPTMHFILRLASIFLKKNKMVAENPL